jgi:hypothetical protein
MKGNSTPSYVLTLRPLPDSLDPEGIRRLRALVKAALRSYRLRCVAIAPGDGQQAELTPLGLEPSPEIAGKTKKRVGSAANPAAIRAANEAL